MGSRTGTYTFTGSEGYPTWFIEIPVPTFTGAWSISFHLSAPSTGLYTFSSQLADMTDLTDCWHSTTWMFSGETDRSWSWAVDGSFTCSDWTHFRVVLTTGGNHPPAGMTITATITGSFTDIPTGICIYGTQQKDPTISVVDVGVAFIANLVRTKDWRWAAALVAGLIGRQILLSQLCAQLPPADEDLEPGDFVPHPNLHVFPDVERKMGIKLLRYLWDTYCECKPPTGGGGPTDKPGPPNLVQPTWYVTQNNYTITNNDIANILNIYLTLQGGQTNIDHQLTAAASDSSPCSPAQFEESTVHDNLLGEGRFEVADVVGFKIEALERDISEPILSGQPQYLWNMGWISTLAGELLLDEKRVTRSGYYWFPCSIQHATEFTYTLRQYTKLRVTELVRPSQIVLMGG